MKKAVIQTGGKQYLVAEGDEIEIERLQASKNLNLKPLLVINEANIQIGTPELDKAEVILEIGEEVLGNKVVAIRYKAKKRVKKVRGHRQKHLKAKIVKIKA